MDVAAVPPGPAMRGAVAGGAWERSVARGQRWAGAAVPLCSAGGASLSINASALAENVAEKLPTCAPGMSAGGLHRALLLDALCRHCVGVLVLHL